MSVLRRWGPPSLGSPRELPGDTTPRLGLGGGIGVSLCFGFCLICRDPSSDSIRALVLRTSLEMGHTCFIFKIGFSTNPPERPPCVLNRVKSLLCTSTALGILPLMTGLTPIFRLTSELQQVGRGSRAQHGAHPAAHRPATT